MIEDCMPHYKFNQNYRMLIDLYERIHLRDQPNRDRFMCSQRMPLAECRWIEERRKRSMISATFSFLLVTFVILEIRRGCQLSLLDVFLSFLTLIASRSLILLPESLLVTFGGTKETCILLQRLVSRSLRGITEALFCFFVFCLFRSLRVSNDVSNDLIHAAIKCKQLCRASIKTCRVWRFKRG